MRFPNVHGRGPPPFFFPSLSFDRVGLFSHLATPLGPPAPHLQIFLVPSPDYFFSHLHALPPPTRPVVSVVSFSQIYSSKSYARSKIFFLLTLFFPETGGVATSVLFLRLFPSGSPKIPRGPPPYFTSRLSSYSLVYPQSSLLFLSLVPLQTFPPHTMIFVTPFFPLMSYSG